MRCHDVEALLPQFAADELPSPNHRLIARHLDQCDDCRGSYRRLRQALSALEQARPSQAPDLWSDFQTRLHSASADLQSSCTQAISWQSEFMDGKLSTANATRLALHLEQCPSCSREYGRLVRSLSALDAAAPAPVDLWGAFEHRLSATVSCSAVQSRLPEAVDAPDILNTLEFRAHLRHCADCSAEYAALSGALARLELVGSRLPSVDLWPAFERRLAGERSVPPARRGRLRDMLPRWTPFPPLGHRSHALVPVGMAIAVLLFFPLASPVSRPHVATPQPAPAQLAMTPPSADVVRPEQRDPLQAAPNPSSSSERSLEHARPRPALRPKPRRSLSRVVTRIHKQAAPRRIAKQLSGHVVSAAKTPSPPVLAEAAQRPTPALRVAYNLDRIVTSPPFPQEGEVGRMEIIPPAVPDDVTQTKQDGKEAFLRAVELLAEQENALQRPFEATSDAGW